MSDAEKHYQKMTLTPVPKLILQLGIPTAISMLITSLYNMADTYFVGTIGPSAQAATGVLFTLQSIIQGIGVMLGHGGGTYISKSLADRDVPTASRYISTSFFSGLLIGLVFSVVGLCFLSPLVKLLGSTDTILPHAMDYGFWILLACPFIMCSFILNNGLRYEGRALYAMIALASGGILNIFGDYLLVYRMQMGVYGAGLATAVSQVFGFFFLLFMFRKMAQSRISIASVDRHPACFFKIVHVGFPSLIRQSLNSVTHGILNNLTKPFGDAAIAAMSVVNRYSMFLMCVGLGIGQGFQPVASFNYQAKKYDRVKQGLKFTMFFCFLFIGTLSIISAVFAEPVISVFQKRQEVIDIGATALRYTAVGMLFITVSIPVNMLFQSIQKPTIASFLSMIRSGGITIPLLIILVPALGLTGVQISQPIADVVSGLISLPLAVKFLHAEPKELRDFQKAAH